MNNITNVQANNNFGTSGLGGIVLLNSQEVEVSSNTANNNQNAGIYLFNSDNNNITGNFANNTAGITRQQHGILLEFDPYDWIGFR